MRTLLMAGTFAISSLTASAGYAQARPDPARDFAVWAGVISTVDLGREAPSASLWLDTHLRRGDAGTLFILRPAVGLRATSWLTLHAGYAWIPFFDDANATRRDEHRIWQQAIVAGDVGRGVSLQSRTRNEQRFGPGDGVGHRLRQFVRLGWTRGAVGVVVWDELFLGFNTTEWGAQRGYDQNRLFVGASIAIGASSRLEVGYLAVHLNRERDEWVHALALNLFLHHRP